MAIVPDTTSSTDIHRMVDDGAYPRTNAETLANGRVNEPPPIPAIPLITEQVRKLDLSAWPMARAKMNGAPRYAEALIEADISVKDLERRFACGGLECYTDCNGALVIRTVESGNAHRAQVQAERQARADHASRHAEIVRQEVTELRLTELDPDWRSKFLDWTVARVFYRDELAESMDRPRASRVIHHSNATDPTDYSDEREPDPDDVSLDDDLEDGRE